MPTMFIAHSAPTLALDNIAGEDYKNLGSRINHPSAILVFSAHWESEQLSAGETTTHSDLVYDFGGFQDALYEMQYPAPGAPELLKLVKSILEPETKVVETSRGLDHGVWVPFLHLWPKADIPILQLSIPYNFPEAELLHLGARLKSLREQRVLIVCTGVITHNLRTVDPRNAGAPPPWALEFDQWVENVLINHDYDKLIHWQSTAPHAQMNHPTPEHFRPLIIAAGAAQNETVQFPITGFEWGSLSRRSVLFGQI